MRDSGRMRTKGEVGNEEAGSVVNVAGAVELHTSEDISVETHAHCGVHTPRHRPEKAAALFPSALLPNREPPLSHMQIVSPKEKWRDLVDDIRVISSSLSRRR